MNNSTFYDFLKINRKRTNRPLLWSVICLLFLTLTTLSLKAQTGTIQIGSGTTDTPYGTPTTPMFNYYYVYSQQIVKASEFASGGGTAGNITKIRWMFPNIGSPTSNYGDWDIWIGHTTKTEFTSGTDWVSISDMQQIFSGNIHTAGTPGPTNNNWFEINFSTPFTYNGTDNIVVAVHEKTPGYMATGMTIRTYISTPNTGIVYVSDVTNPNPATPPSTNHLVSRLAQIQFEGTLASCQPPMNLTFTQSSLTSGALGWTSDGDLFDVEWGEAGFSLGSGTKINGLTTNSLDITTVFETDYQFYVRRDCGGGDVSIWQGPFDFFSGYCVPFFAVSSGYGHIKSFVTTGSVVGENINNVTNAQSSGGYGNFSNLSAVTTPGTTIGFNAVFETTLGAGFAIWIDWNENGTFEANERVFNTTTKVITATGNISIPSDALGTYRMRIMSDYDLPSPVNPCVISTLVGEAEDYTLDIINFVACSGTPNVPNIVISPTTANAGSTYNITASGYSISEDLTFQWEIYNENTSSWDEIGTATSLYEALTEQIAPVGVGTEVKYRLKTTCNNSNQTSYSNQATFTTQKVYCTPSFSGSIGYIKKFETTGASTNISNETNAQSQNGYGDFTSQSVVVTASTSFDFSATSQNSNGWAIWIDWNENGTFEAEEKVFNTTSFVGSISGTINVPVAALGIYKMRVLCEYSYSNPTNPCIVTSSSGEIEDYTIDVQAMPPCVGTPNVPNIEVSPIIGNPGSTYNVIATGYSINADLTFQWETYNENTTQWESYGTSSIVYEALTETAPITIGIEVKYRLKVTCNNSSETVYSNQVTFTTQKVYCTPSFSSSSGYIKKFETTGASTNISNETNAQSQNGYGDFTPQSVVVTAGTSFDFSASSQSTNGWAIWIDWNDNGTFEADERVFNTTGYVGSISGTINVPMSALGSYRMRVMCNYTSTNPTDPCVVTTSGEVEDYTIDVQAMPPCVGTPNVPNIEVSPTTNQAGSTYSVKASGYSINSDLTFQWEIYNENTSSWDEIGTANYIYEDLTEQIAPAGLGTQVKYRLKVTCNNSNETAYSSEATFTTGYCTPSFSGSSGYIKKFETTGGNTNISNETNAQSTGGYGYFVSQSVVVTAGTSFDFSASSQSTNGWAIWIDWNGNGVFDTDERVLNTTGYVGNIAGTINVPMSALGSYRMRVMCNYSSINPNDPCIVTTFSGEVEDYTIDVQAMTPCVGTPNVPNIEVSPITNEAGSTYSVKASGYSINTDLSFQWETYNQSTNQWESNGASSQFYQDLIGQIAPPNMGDQVKYRLKVTCNNSGETAYSNEAIFTTGYCTPSGLTSSSSYYISSASTSGAFIDLSYTGSAVAYVDDTVNTVYALQDSSFTFTINQNSSTGKFYIWADLNDNGVFDTNETIMATTTFASSATGTITIPANFQVGNYRIRISNAYLNSNTPCGSATYGNYVDFTLAVIDPPTCMPVSLPITATNSSATSVLLEWVSDGTSFDIEYGVQGFTQGSGTTITEVSNPYILQGLTAGTQYEYYVRQNCGNGDESIWRGPVSFIPGNFDGKISSRLHTEPQVTSLACGSTFAIDVPAGKQIASLKVDYMMTSVSPRWMSEQRSVLYSPTLNAGEPDVVSGPSANDFPGVQDYSRSVNFANGATGTVEFELKAWRIAGNQGCTDNEIFVEPGTWILTPTFEDIPACPNPPTDLGYNVISESSVELFWTAGTSGATHQLKYGNIGFDVNTAGTSEDNLTVNSFTINGLDSSITYEFYVRRDCGAGDFSTWIGPFKFNSGYCIPTSDITYHFTVFNTTNAIQNASYSGTSSGTGYVNNTNEVDLVIEQEHGQSFDFSSNYIGGASGLRIWVDWNKDFVFDDSEQVFYLANANGSKSGTITVPLNTLTGDYRMRVRAEQGSSAIPSACGEIAMGEALDFTLKVNGAVSVTNFDLYEFRYHPNPVNDILHFSSNSRIESVTISNILGQQVNANLNSDNTILDMSNLPSGNYFVKVTIEGVSKTIKVIKN